MFKRLYVDNYKCLVNFDLEFQDLTLLLGRNGTGKTSVLDIIYALRELLSGRARIADPEIFPAHTLTAWQTRELQVFEVEAKLPSDTFVYRLQIEHNAKNHLSRISNESLLDADGRPLFEFKGGARCISIGTIIRQAPTSPPIGQSPHWPESSPGPDNTRLTQFLEFIRNVLVCGLYPASFEHETHKA